MFDLNHEVESLKLSRFGLKNLIESVRADNIVLNCRYKNNKLIKIGNSISSTERPPLRPRNVLRYNSGKKFQPKKEQLPL